MKHLRTRNIPLVTLTETSLRRIYGGVISDSTLVLNTMDELAMTAIRQIKG